MSTDPTDEDGGSESTGEATETVAEEVDQRSTDKPELAPDEQYCSSCGEPIKTEAEICTNCGVRQKSDEQPQTQVKNPGIAAVLSFLFTGLGQIYNGQIAKGIALIVVQAINIALMFVVIGFFTYFIVWIYGLYDAYKTAERINRGEVSV